MKNTIKKHVVMSVRMEFLMNVIRLDALVLVPPGGTRRPSVYHVKQNGMRRRTKGEADNHVNSAI